MMDPLVQYHTLLKQTRGSGYPNMQFFQPHPYMMAYQGMLSNPYQKFQQFQGYRQQPLRQQPYRQQYQVPQRGFLQGSLGGMRHQAPIPGMM